MFHHSPLSTVNCPLSTKTLLLCFTFSIFNFQLSINKALGQDTRQFHSGIIAGLSTSQVDGDQLAGYNKVGIKAGAFVLRNLTQFSSLQMEILFIQKGSRAPVNPDDNTYFVMRLNYLEVPLIFRYQFSKKIIAEAGPSFATLIHSEEIDQVGPILSRPPFRKQDLLANAGGYYVFDENWSFNFRFSYSIFPIRPYYSGRPYDFFDRGQYNNLLALALQYQF